MLVYRRIIGTSKTGAELLLLLRFAIRGEGVLSEIKRVVNIPGYNNNLVQNEEFSPHLGKPSPTFPPTTSCIIRWKIAGGDLCE